MISAPEILQLIALGVSGWTLLEVIALKTNFAAMNQKVKDLPCKDCHKDA